MPTATPPENLIRYILDTDIITYQQRGDQRIIQKLELLDPNEVAVTVVSMYEQLRGRLANINRKQSVLQLQRAFELLERTQTYYCRVPIVSFDNDARIIYEQLRKLKLRIGTQDTQIAAITLTHSAILVTNNQRHFSRIPNLQLASWI